MKKLILIALLIFSSPSYAEWTKVSKDSTGTTFYVDFDRIRNVDGYVYFWELANFIKPNNLGDLSGKRYRQGDCKLFRHKVLSYVFHQQPMGRDIGETANEKNPEWHYPSPNSVNDNILMFVCKWVELSSPADKEELLRRIRTFLRR